MVANAAPVDAAAVMHAEAPAVATRVKIGWAMGSVGTSTMLYLVNVFLLYYLTNYLGIAAAVAGVMLFLTRVYDIIVDPLIGSSSDRTQSRWGRRHPWMLGGAVVAGIGCVLLFNLHEIGIGLNPAVTAGLVMLVYFTGYTAFYIPHMCLASEMTRSYDERTSVMVFRTTLITISGIAVTAGIPALIELWGGRQQSYGRIGVVAGVAVFAAMLIAVLTTPRDAVREYARPEALRWADIRRLLRNGPFVCLLVAKVIGLLGIGFSGPVLLLFFTEVLGRSPGSLGLWGLATGVGGLIGLPFWSWLSRQVGKKRACLVSYTMHAILAATWWLAAPGESDAVFIGRVFLAGVAGQGSLTLGMAMLLDVLAHATRATGQSREGLMVGVFALAEKGAYAFGPLLAGLLLGAMGFVSSTTGTVAQPASAMLAARLAMSLIPAAIGVVALVAISMYRLPAETARR